MNTDGALYTLDQSFTPKHADLIATHTPVRSDVSSHVKSSAMDVAAHTAAAGSGGAGDGAENVLTEADTLSDVCAAEAMLSLAAGKRSIRVHCTRALLSTFSNFQVNWLYMYTCT